jgi:hypothetical protein
MSINHSSVEYRRIRNVRTGRRSLCCGGRDGLPDLSETALPRLQKGQLLSHERGQKRMRVWVKNYA